MIKKDFSRYAKPLFVICVIFFLFFSIMFISKTNELNLGNIEPSIWGNYGSLIGGFLGPILSLASILFILDNLEHQKESLEQQKESVEQQKKSLRLEKINFIKDQVENRFFELIKFHKQNVNEIRSLAKDKNDIFVELNNNFQYNYDFIKGWYNKPENKTALDWQKEVIQIAYILFFYGYDVKDTKSKENLLNWIKIITKSQEHDLKWLMMVEAMVKNFPEHQSYLSQYYRHLYQSVKFINGQPSEYFNYNEKYNFVKTLRAQLSNHEQALLLYNSVSPLGEAWELNVEESRPNNRMITKYNMIKNLPNGFTKEIDPKCFYPDVFFEFDVLPTEKRKDLESLYK